MDFIKLMEAASCLLKAKQISQEEWNTINGIAEAHTWE